MRRYERDEFMRLVEVAGLQMRKLSEAVMALPGCCSTGACGVDPSRGRPRTSLVRLRGCSNLLILLLDIETLIPHVSCPWARRW